MIKLKINQESLKKMKSGFKGPRADIPNSLDERFNHFLPMESRLDIGDTILEELSRMGLSEHSKESELPPLRLFPESQDKRKLIEELPEGYRSHDAGNNVNKYYTLYMYIIYIHCTCIHTCT